MGEEGHVMLLLAGDLGCDLRVGRTFRTPQRGFWRQGLAHRQQILSKNTFGRHSSY